MPQLSDCIRWADRKVITWAGPPGRRWQGTIESVRVLQVKRNGEWVEVPYEEEHDDAAERGGQ